MALGLLMFTAGYGLGEVLAGWPGQWADTVGLVLAVVTFVAIYRAARAGEPPWH